MQYRQRKARMSVPFASRVSSILGTIAFAGLSIYLTQIKADISGLGTGKHCLMIAEPD